MSLHVIILAAGQGKRMRSALPKVLQPLAGRPLLAHVIDVALQLEPERVHVVYGHGGEQVTAAFAELPLSWSLQERQLGTGHAVSCALPGVPAGARVLVLCGDVPLVQPATLRELLADSQAPLGLVTATVADPTGYGRVLRNTAGDVTGIVEQREASPAQLAITEINTGIMAMDADSLREWLGAIGNDNAQGEFYLTDAIGLAAAAGHRISTVHAGVAGDWLGINDKHQLADAERRYQRRAAAALLDLGVTLIDPARVDIRGTVEVGQDVFIDVGVVLQGRVKLGNRVRLEPYVVLTDTELGDDTVVHAHSHLDRASTGKACEIGPFARLRPGAALAERVKVGNFVEIKNSDVAAGSKINHLTYIGDASIATNVNVGAGTITCNYDGAGKHRTVIGDDAFIGSGAMLVAPVTIGNGATIGAGSTITKDVPARQLTVARSRQVTVPSWQRPVKRKP